MSGRTWSAVRARVAATPGPSSASSIGSTVWRTRLRVNRGSSLAGSVHQSMPSAWQAASVWARVRSSSGRRKSPQARRIPASDRPPLPRARPSSTVSAWSSRVWPSSTTLRAEALRELLEDGVAGLPRRRLGPWPSVLTATRAVAVSSAPRMAIWATTRTASSAESSRSPWSTVTPTTDQGRSRASNTAAASRASESAPPEHATSTGWPPGSAAPASARRTASRVAATAGSGPWSPRGPCVTQAAGSAISALVGRWAGSLPDGVELGHADLVDDAADEAGAVAVLRHLGVQAEGSAHAACRGCRDPGGAW